MSQQSRHARMRGADSPVKEFLEAFLGPGRGLASKSRGDYARYLREFDDFTGNTDLRTALTLKHGERFRDHLGERSRTVSRNGTMYLKSFASWLAETGVLTTEDGGSILARLKAPRVVMSKQATLTAQDLDAIWTVLADRPPRQRYRAMAYVRLLLVTGARKMTVASVLFKDIEFDANGTSGWVTVRSRGSTDRFRFDADTGAAILHYIEEERPQSKERPPEPLFLTERGGKFSAWGFSTWSDQIGAEIERVLGIKWSAEVMRRTWKQEAKLPFRDPELRSTCMEILNGDANYDQAVMVASQILESRIRDATEPPPSERSGVRLMKFAFGDHGRLRLSDDDTEQRGALEMFTGLMTYYRNPSIHRLRDDLDKSEVLRIVSWIDHLLMLIGRAGTKGPRSRSGGRDYSSSK